MSLGSLGPKSRGRSTRTRRTHLFLDNMTLGSSNIDGSLIQQGTRQKITTVNVLTKRFPHRPIARAIPSDVYHFPKVAFSTIARKEEPRWITP